MAEKRVLIISLGSIGLRHLRNTRQLLPNAKIAVYRQHNKNGAPCPSDANLLFTCANDALNFSPHAVIIASPASEHLKNAEPFLKQGAALFIEKPLAASNQHVDHFLATAKAAKQYIMVGYILRFLPALHAIKKLLLSDQLGTVRTARIEVGQYLPDWRPDSDYRKGVSAQKKLGGGVLLELSHELDYATWLFGIPDQLQCSAAHLSDLEIDVEDSAHIMMEYTASPSPKHVLVQLDFLQRTANMAVQIVGSEATLYANLITEKLWIVTPSSPEPVMVKFTPSTNGNEVYLRQFDHFFYRAFEDYTPIFESTSDFNDAPTLMQATELLHLIDIAKQASITGQRMLLTPRALQATTS
jgi:predicted dehydrogenase